MRRSLRTDLLIGGLFATLFLVNIAHHALWRDEIIAWMIALTSATPADLFAALHYDGHPGLWHALLWPLTRITPAPEAMKIVHAAIGLALIFLIAGAAPFSRIEKVLLLGGYFISFDYTVISRNYGIGLLLALLYARQRAHTPHAILANALLLALLANTNIFACILSMVLALEYVIDRWYLIKRGPHGARTRLAIGAGLYAAGLALAVATVWPAADLSREITSPLANVASPGHLLKTFLRFVDIGLVPIRTEAVFGPFMLFAPDAAAIPALWPQMLACVALIGMIAWIFRREPTLLLVIAATVIGAVLFGHLVYAVAIRHWGIVFVAFITCLWMQRARRPQRSWPVLILLGFGAIGGVQAASLQWRMPFSMAGATAAWITQQGLADAPMIGVPDTHAVAVAAYLERPITMLECHCTARRAVFSSARDGFSRDNLPIALAAAARAQPVPMLLISAWDLRADELAAIAAVGIELTLLTTQTGAWVDEAFTVYAMRVMP